MNDVQKTLDERGGRYGDFTHHADICQTIKSVLMAHPGWTRLSAVQKQALDVIADKIARILSGDPNYADNWHDIQGYARLVEERLPKEKLTGESVSQPIGGGVSGSVNMDVGDQSATDALTEEVLKDMPPELRSFLKSISSRDDVEIKTVVISPGGKTSIDAEKLTRNILRNIHKS